MIVNSYALGKILMKVNMDYKRNSPKEHIIVGVKEEDISAKKYRKLCTVKIRHSMNLMRMKVHLRRVLFVCVCLSCISAPS